MKTVRLGDYIEQRREKNNNYDVPIRGVTRDGFISPKQDGDLSLYNVFYKDDFVFNPARMEINSIYLNTEFDKAICSSLYEIFYVKDTNVLLPEYLFLFMKRDEFARYCWFDAIGSARNYYRVSNLSEVKIPLPSIDVQRELVAVYGGLKALAEENEALLQPLSEACQAFIVDCKKKYPSVKLGKYIEECKAKNKDLNYGVDYLQGVTNSGKFEDSKANTIGLDFSNYKIVSKNDFAYNPSRINVGSIALSQREKTIVSPMYVVFKLISDKLLPEFLFLWFLRKEFQRSTLFYAMGSVRDTFDYNLMCEVEIPLPPIDIQQKVVDLYNCYEEAKRIASEAREQLKTICPALVQKAAHS